MWKWSDGMMDWVKAERKFVAIAGGLVLVLFFWNLFVRAPLARAIDLGRSKKRAAASALESMSAQGIATRGQIRHAKEECGNLRARLQALEERVGFELDPGHRPPAGELPVTHFHNLLARATSELPKKVQARRIAWNVKDRNLGFPAQRILDDQGEEYLVRLALVNRVIEVLVNQPPGAVDSVEQIVPDPEDAGMVEGGTYLSRIPVSVRFRATGPATFRILHALVKGEPEKKRSGVILDHFEASRVDVNRDLLEVSLQVSALLIDPKGALTEEESWEDE